MNTIEQQIIHPGFFKPMRPGISLSPLDAPGAAFPQGWEWQAKIDDERGVLDAGGNLWNRHGERISWHKEAPFSDAIGFLANIYPGTPLDVALLGFRDTKNYRTARGAIVVLDMPWLRLPWVERSSHLHRLPSLDPLNPRWLESVSPDKAYRLTVEFDPVEAFRLSRVSPGVEGLVGRNPALLYQFGDSDGMVKARWKYSLNVLKG